MFFILKIENKNFILYKKKSSYRNCLCYLIMFIIFAINFQIKGHQISYKISDKSIINNYIISMIKN